MKEYTEENLDEVKLIASGNTSEMRLLTNKVENLDNKSRQRNLVVDGLPESADKSDKESLVKYIQKVLPDFTETNITSLYRVGKLRSDRRKKNK